ncbi:unnamed protein product [Moneuplotes crassus]|uniref:Uncharacterized protein n=1 Tax=Euplotes crassus TaxID=5936 RepID=A0AAD1XBM1_EUPCR|nr:unnamed protein product [Moneuplotes crassus]
MGDNPFNLHKENMRYPPRRYEDQKRDVYYSYEDYDQDQFSDKKKKDTSSCKNQCQKCCTKNNRKFHSQYKNEIKELKLELNKLAKKIKTMSGKSPDREFAKIKKENEKLTKKLDEKDHLILKLSKDNANLIKSVAKLKQYQTSSANSSTDHTNLEGSKYEKPKAVDIDPRGSSPVKTKNFQKDKISTDHEDEYLKTGKLEEIVSSKSENRNKANSPYKSIKNRVSIERNFKEDRDAASNNLPPKRNNSLAFIRPAKNIDSDIHYYCSTAEKNKKNSFRKSFLEVGVRKSKNFLNEDYQEKPLTQKNKIFYEKETCLTSAKKPKYRSKRANDVQKPEAEGKQRSSFYDNKISFRGINPTIDTTPNVKSSQYKKGKRQSMEPNVERQRYASSLLMSEQKQNCNKILESQDIFNLRNSKVMDAGYSDVKQNYKICSLEKKRNQRKQWKKRS